MFYGGGPVVVDSLFSVAPIVYGDCVWFLSFLVLQYELVALL